MNPIIEDTICAPATPAGKGGVSMVRVSGPDALRSAVALAGKRMEGLASHTFRLATLRDSEGIIDQAVVGFYAGPASYTGEDVVELAVHGSPYIVERLMRALMNQGVRMAAPGEFTQRAFLNGRMDLSQAEAVADLIAGENKATHDMAMRQLRGGFSSEIEELRSRLLEFVSLVELELDFGEEDVEFADRTQLDALLAEIARKVAVLKDSFRLGNALKEGIPVAIIGKPNAGKSTLINALLHEERALVSDIPGTTRDTIEEVWHIDGVKFRFIDTAGLRESEDTVERMGIERTLMKMRQARVWLYLFDREQMTEAEARREVADWRRKVGLGEVSDSDTHVSGNRTSVGQAVAAVLKERPSVSVLSGWEKEEPFILLIGNKADKTACQPGWAADDLLCLSAKKEWGLELLQERLRSLIPSLPDSEAAILNNARHYEALCLVSKDLEKIRRGLSENLPGDLLSMDIRSAIDHLGLITGKILTDDILGEVFSRFCIGK